MVCIVDHIELLLFIWSGRETVIYATRDPKVSFSQFFTTCWQRLAATWHTEGIVNHITTSKGDVVNLLIVWYVVSGQVLFML